MFIVIVKLLFCFAFGIYMRMAMYNCWSAPFLAGVVILLGAIVKGGVSEYVMFAIFTAAAWLGSIMGLKIAALYEKKTGKLFPIGGGVEMAVKAEGLRKNKTINK